MGAAYAAYVGHCKQIYAFSDRLGFILSAQLKMLSKGCAARL